MFCSQKLFKKKEMKCITFTIYIFINEQIKLFEYTFLQNKVNASKKEEKKYKQNNSEWKSKENDERATKFYSKYKNKGKKYIF